MKVDDFILKISNENLSIGQWGRIIYEFYLSIKYVKRKPYRYILRIVNELEKYKHSRKKFSDIQSAIDHNKVYNPIKENQLNNETKTNRIDKDLKIPYPPLGRPKTSRNDTPHQVNNRDYIHRDLKLGFATIDERENFDNMIINLKHKRSEKRQDVIIMDGLKLLKDLTDGKIKIINIEEEK